MRTVYMNRWEDFGVLVVIFIRCKLFALWLHTIIIDTFLYLALIWSGVIFFTSRSIDCTQSVNNELLILNHFDLWYLLIRFFFIYFLFFLRSDDDQLLTYCFIFLLIFGLARICVHMKSVVVLLSLLQVKINFSTYHVV